ncbi:MAG: caspase family protein [Cyclobacteriaceae bacterium]|nr:caspase family protein [Cyclobacteriaceae bacterium]
MKTVIAIFLLVFLHDKTRAQKPELMVQTGHTFWVQDVKFSPDSKYVITFGSTTCKLWESKTGKLIRNLQAQLRGIKKIEFSSNGTKILTSSWDETSRLWEAESGKLLHTFEGSAATFDKNNSLVFTMDNGIGKIWSCSTGKLNNSFKVPDWQSLKNVYFSDNISYLTLIFNDKVISWDIKSGLVKNRIEPKSAFGFIQSKDGKFILSGISETKEWMKPNGKLQVWETLARMPFKTISGNTYASDFSYAAISENFKYFGVGGGSRVMVWNLTTSEMPIGWEVSRFDDSKIVFSPNGEKMITYSSRDTQIRIWETKTGTLLATLSGHAKPVKCVNWSPDEKMIITGSEDGESIIWNADKYELKTKLESLAEISTSILSPDGNLILMRFEKEEKGISLIDSKTGLPVFLNIANDSIITGEFTPDGTGFLTRSKKNETYLKYFNSDQQWLVSSTDESSFFSPSGKYILLARSDSILTLWNTKEKRKVCFVYAHLAPFYAFSFSNDEKILTTTSNAGNNTSVTKIWETSSGRLLSRLPGLFDYTQDFRGYHQAILNGDHLITTQDGKKTKVYDWHTQSLISELDGIFYTTFFPFDGVLRTETDHSSNFYSIPDGKLLKSIKHSSDAWMQVRYQSNFLQKAYVKITPDSVKLWESGRSRESHGYPTVNKNDVYSFDWASKSKILGHDNNSKNSIYDLNSRQELLSWITLKNNDWVVTHPSGLFDASPGAFEKLYFIQGFDVIQFDQLKDRYYEPGLWKKVMSGEKLRNVVGFKSIDLPPDIRVGQVDSKGYLPIALTNRGGGIGEVTVYVNGKEVAKDTRDKNANPDAPTTSINHYVGNLKNLANGNNIIAVKAWNKDHWVESRGEMVTYTKGAGETYQPMVHILACGISDYAGGADIDLTYAAKDADDVGKALKLGAAKLFGAQKSYVYNLTTSQPKEFWPTKTNILKTFEKISSTAHPLDVIVVYLSGHGINIGGTEGDWHYLTQEVYTASATAYSDPAIRQQTTISSNELVELFKTIPAAKQVLMIDACASGKVVDNLVAKKDVPSSTLRALDRMKDRTGMHIITGCTADAVSYEASRYGQGVLTYSLLEGIRGAALREDEFIDINKLFQYAQDRVPALATGIGGIQTPMVFSPNGSQSFDIGQLTETEKKQVPIAKIRPVYIQSNFQDEDEMADVLGLGKKVDLLLGESAARGTEAPLIFVPVREYPDGCQLVGRYKKVNGKYVLKLKKRCEGKDVTVDITGTDLNDLSNQVSKVVTN